MNIINILIPHKTKEVPAVETCVVQWIAAEVQDHREDSFHLKNSKAHYQAFTNRQEAEEFKEALILSFKTIRGGVPKINIYKEK